MSYNIIPKPALSSLKNGSFKITSDLKIYSSTETKYLRTNVIDWIQMLFNFNVKPTNAINADRSINLILNPEMYLANDMGYILEITRSTLIIQGKTHIGLFYGIQSLKQILLDSKKRSINEIRCGKIQDFPRFLWRGFMLDSGRHFHPVSTIKKLLDIMALLKMNVFHWHLTEDQGWRIEIKKYPKLTEIGSKRNKTNISYFWEKNFTGEPHEGFFTQEEIKEVVQYASERFITVIPEIELPGHSVAAIASYPELCCTGEQIEVATDRGIFPDIYCAGKESTFSFLQDVLDEVISLFPSDIVHIGGDESPKKRWKSCPACQKRIEEEGLKDENELQVYFTNRIGKFLKSKGKRLMGWNEILGDNLDPSAICQWWIGKKKIKLKHLRQGREMVMSNRYQTYLNLKCAISPMRFFYNWDPIPDSLRQEYINSVIGIEAPIWTETIPTYELLGIYVFPRLFATAEVAWTQKHQKNYEEFKQGIPNLFMYLGMLEMPYISIKDADPSTWQRMKKPLDILLLLGMHVFFFFKEY